ncbi:hypothetical protein DY000_02040655 [Brassica cretica]|uniref:Uncharacterized protein n=1 Tax=Brassica cretica TaxID=69181 RepID=A0ABQ7BNA3_BRACR|nr:hypothetical protein DY000_02040655 [Brassica cretica]
MRDSNFSRLDQPFPSFCLSPHFSFTLISLRVRTPIDAGLAALASSRQEL